MSNRFFARWNGEHPPGYEGPWSYVEENGCYRYVDKNGAMLPEKYCFTREKAEEHTLELNQAWAKQRSAAAGFPQDLSGRMWQARTSKFSSPQLGRYPQRRIMPTSVASWEREMSKDEVMNKMFYLEERLRKPAVRSRKSILSEDKGKNRS